MRMWSVPSLQSGKKAHRMEECKKSVLPFNYNGSILHKANNINNPPHPSRYVHHKGEAINVKGFHNINITTDHVFEEMADQVARIPKPMMRRMLHAQIKRSLVIAIGLGIAGAVAFKFAVVEPRKTAYANFYRTYDAEKSFESMRKKGLFQSCPAD